MALPRCLRMSPDVGGMPVLETSSLASECSWVMGANIGVFVKVVKFMKFVISPFQLSDKQESSESKFGAAAVMNSVLRGISFCSSGRCEDHTCGRPNRLARRQRPSNESMPCDDEETWDAEDSLIAEARYLPGLPLTVA